MRRLSVGTTKLLVPRHRVLGQIYRFSGNLASEPMDKHSILSLLEVKLST